MELKEQYDVENAEVRRCYNEMTGAVRGEIDCPTCVLILNYLAACNKPQYNWQEVLMTARIHQAAHLAKAHRQATFLP